MVNRGNDGRRGALCMFAIASSRIAAAEAIDSTQCKEECVKLFACARSREKSYRNVGVFARKRASDAEEQANRCSLRVHRQRVFSY